MSKYPMVPVPEALDVVLREAARVVLSGDGAGHDGEESIPVSDPTGKLLGRISSRDVSAPHPGYPPFDASIMDGYAVHVPVPDGDEDDEKAAGVTAASSALVEEVKGENDGVLMYRYRYKVVGSVYAGEYHDADRADGGDGGGDRIESSPPLPPATYVTTGAVVPPRYNAVVPVEDCTLADTSSPSSSQILTVIRDAPTKVGEWIRPTGCDVASGGIVVRAGTEIRPPEVALLAQCGVSMVPVRRRPKVGVLSTGNEIKPLPTTAAAGSMSQGSRGATDGGRAGTDATGLIFDANRPALLALLAAMGGVVGVDLGIATDDLDALEGKLRIGLEECDVLITSGGVSMGEKDLLEEVLVQRLGAHIHFGRLHMKPGKPTTFLTWAAEVRDASGGNGGRVSDISSSTKLVFALPGNPVSAMVCCHLLVRPALDLLRRGAAEHGGTGKHMTAEEIAREALVHPEVDAILQKDAKLDKERPEYHRVTLQWEGGNGTGGGGDHGGRLVAVSTGTQRSSRLLSMSGARGLACLPQGVPGENMVCRAGESVRVLLIGGGGGGVVIPGVKWKDSMHAASARPPPRKKKKKTILIGIMGMNASPSSEGEIKRIVQEALAPALVTYSKLDAAVDRGAFASALKDDMGDTHLALVVAGGGFRRELEASSVVDAVLEKRADAMALQARSGAATKNGLCALFEVVVGWAHGKLIVCLPEGGLEGGLRRITPLMGHAIGVGSGNHKH